MKPEDESPTQKRNRKNDIDEGAKRLEDMRSEGGGRLKTALLMGCSAVSEKEIGRRRGIQQQRK